MRNFLVLFFIGFLSMSFVARQSSMTYNLIAAFKANAKLIHTDNLGNLYVVTQTNQLNKYGRNGALLATLNYNYTGSITQIDASNPMQIFLFYRELNKVIFLDNNLAYRGEIDLAKAEIIQASAIARAYDNNLWVFDLGDLQLKKINQKNSVEQTSGNIRQYIVNNAAVSMIYDNDDRVFVVDSLNGVMVFDVFASYIKTIPIKGVSDMKISNKSIYYYQDGMLNKYNWQASLNTAYAMPDTFNVTKITIEKERIYLQKPDSIYIYSY